MEVANQVAEPSIIWPLVAGVLIVLANAFFVSVEFAVVTVRRGQVDRLVEQGHGAAVPVQQLLKDPDWAIAAVATGHHGSIDPAGRGGRGAAATSACPGPGSEFSDGCRSWRASPPRWRRC